MKTAVEWLEKHITDSYYQEFIEKAKKMEREQMVNAWENGKKSTQCKTPMCERKTGIGYYNKTFKQQEQ
jgi:uncharacterized protein YkwD